MSYRDVLRRVSKKRVLHSVIFELTFNCNLDCFICYNEKGKRGQRLNYKDYQTILQDLSRLGTMNVTLSGGEPLVHSDFFQIGACARELGFVVRIKSNGNLINEQRARRIQQEISPFYIEMSLHGSQAATHDRQTGLPGSFTELIENARTMRKIGLSIRFNTPLTQWNQQEMESMQSLADSLEAPIRFDFHITPRDDGSLEPLSIAPTKQVLDDYIARHEPTGHNKPASDDCDDGVCGDAYCGVGFTSLVIDPFGDVFPCVQMRDKIGNLHQYSMPELWPDAPVLQRARSKNIAVRSFLEAQGDGAMQSGFCPAVAEKINGKSTSFYASVESVRASFKKLRQQKAST